MFLVQKPTELMCWKPMAWTCCITLHMWLSKSKWIGV